MSKVTELGNDKTLEYYPKVYAISTIQHVLFLGRLGKHTSARCQFLGTSTAIRDKGRLWMGLRALESFLLGYVRDGIRDTED